MSYEQRSRVGIVVQFVYVPEVRGRFQRKDGRFVGVPGSSSHKSNSGQFRLSRKMNTLEPSRMLQSSIQSVCVTQ